MSLNSIEVAIGLVLASLECGNTPSGDQIDRAQSPADRRAPARSQSRWNGRQQCFNGTSTFGDLMGDLISAILWRSRSRASDARQ